jgi:hypothetical protein
VAPSHRDCLRLTRMRVDTVISFLRQSGIKWMWLLAPAQTREQGTSYHASVPFRPGYFGYIPLGAYRTTVREAPGWRSVHGSSGNIPLGPPACLPNEPM